MPQPFSFTTYASFKTQTQNRLGYVSSAVQGVCSRIQKLAVHIFNRLQAHLGYWVTVGALSKKQVETYRLIGEALEQKTPHTNSQKKLIVRALSKAYQNKALNKKLTHCLAYGHHALSLDATSKSALKFINEYAYRTSAIAQIENVEDLLQRLSRVPMSKDKEIDESVTFTLKEIRVVENIRKLGTLEKQLYRQLGDLDTRQKAKYSPLFLGQDTCDRATELIKRIWDSLSIDDRYINLFREDSGFKLGVSQKKPWSCLSAILRGSIHNHIATLHLPNSEDKPMDSHVNYAGYVKNEFTFNELMGSDHYRLQARKMFTTRGIEVLRKTWGCSEEEAFERANEKIRQVMHELHSSSDSWGKISNNQWLRITSVLGSKERDTPLKPQDYSFREDSSMICSEFVAKLLFQATDKLNEECRNETGYQSLTFVKDPMSRFTRLEKVVPAMFYKEILPTIADSVKPSSLIKRLIKE
jgi:hypothetical protein